MFCALLPKTMDLLKILNYPPTKNIFGGTTKYIGDGLAGVHSTRVPNFRANLQKTAWTLDI